MRCKSLFVVSALLLGPPAYAQDKTAQIDKIFSWVKPGMPGCVAAAAKDGKPAVNRAYDLADLERNVPLTRSDALASGRPGKFVTAKIQEPATLNSGRTLTYARGLMLVTNYANGG